MSIYISIDVEAIDQAPLSLHLLSVGMVAFNSDGEELSDFNVNLNPGWPAEAKDIPPSLSTHDFWPRFPEAYAATRYKPVDHFTGAGLCLDWLRSLGAEKLHHLRFLAYPAGYDWTLVYPWLYDAAPGMELPLDCIDIKTLAATALSMLEYPDDGADFDTGKSTKKRMPKSWFDGMGAHTHLAVDDAREQGQLFFNILQALRVNAA